MIPLTPGPFPASGEGRNRAGWYATRPIDYDGVWDYLPRSGLLEQGDEREHTRLGFFGVFHFGNGSFCFHTIQTGRYPAP